MKSSLELEAVQAFRVKLFMALGKVDGDTDRTITACRALSDMPASSRYEFIAATWKIITPEVEFLLDQLKAAEVNYFSVGQP